MRCYTAVKTNDPTTIMHRCGASSDYLIVEVVKVNGDVNTTETIRLLAAYATMEYGMAQLKLGKDELATEHIELAKSGYTLVVENATNQRLVARANQGLSIIADLEANSK